MDENTKRGLAIANDPEIIKRKLHTIATTSDDNHSIEDRVVWESPSILSCLPVSTEDAVAIVEQHRKDGDTEALNKAVDDKFEAYSKK